MLDFLLGEGVQWGVLKMVGNARQIIVENTSWQFLWGGAAHYLHFLVMIDRIATIKKNCDRKVKIIIFLKDECLVLF